MSKPFCPFPNNFTWGVATAAYQVEGATSEDGRTPSVWDTFTRRPGAIVMDQTGDRGVDHYHLYKDDVVLIRRLGIKAYRFSASWSRVVPSGAAPSMKRVSTFTNASSMNFFPPMSSPG